jgi:hypothetical protein
MDPAANEQHQQRRVGTTSGATMLGENVDDTLYLNVEPFVVRLVDLSSAGLNLHDSTRTEVSSLLWIFLSRSHRTIGMISKKNFGRMITSTRHMLVTVDHYASLRLAGEEGDMSHGQDFIKYWTDYHMWRAVGSFDEPPVRPDYISHDLFAGWWKLYTLRKRAQHDIAFFYSLQKGSRKLWGPLSKLRKAKAIADHRELLTRPVETISDEMSRRIYNVSTLIFSDLIDRPNDGTKFFPSSSASLQATYLDGGALSCFEMMSYPADETSVGELFDLNAHFQQWRQNEYDFAQLASYYRSREMTTSGTSACNDVQIVAIAEPGKFRILSKGDSYLYAALQPIQGRMLSAWKRQRVSTMRGQDLTDKVNEINSLVPEFRNFVSGDYKSSTDYIKRAATLAAVAPLRFTKGGDLAEISFQPGRLLYGNKKQEPVMFAEGQLMGHPLSFPLLCVINLAVYLHTVEQYCDLKGSSNDFRSRLRKAVIVNGDDILFKGDREFFDMFFENASDVGFRKSVGKNYFCPNFCQINSQTFVRKNDRFVRTGYLNLKFLTIESLKGGKSEATPTELGRDISEMVRICPWTALAVPAIFKRFDREYKGGFRPNWYLPVCAGGYGLSAVPPGTWRVSRQQLRVAALFLHDPKLRLYASGVTDAVSLTRHFPGAVANWRVVPFIGPLPEESRELDDDDWLIRLSLIGRALSDPVSLNEAQVRRRVTMFDTIRSVLKRSKGRRRQIVPLTLDQIETLWSVRYVANGLPACPPLLPMKQLAKFTTDPVAAQVTAEAIELRGILFELQGRRF